MKNLFYSFFVTLYWDKSFFMVALQYCYGVQYKGFCLLNYGSNRVVEHGSIHRRGTHHHVTIKVITHLS